MMPEWTTQYGFNLLGELANTFGICPWMLVEVKTTNYKPALLGVTCSIVAYIVQVISRPFFSLLQ